VPGRHHQAGHGHRQQQHPRCHLRTLNLSPTLAPWRARFRMYQPPTPHSSNPTHTVGRTVTCTPSHHCRTDYVIMIGRSSPGDGLPRHLARELRSITLRHGCYLALLPNLPLWDQGAGCAGAHSTSVTRYLAVRPEPRHCARPWRAVLGRGPVGRPAAPSTPWRPRSRSPAAQPLSRATPTHRPD
jgi:hypothetical protein